MTPESSILYFAYGSNMVRRQMAHRCPGATVHGSAILRGHRFVINARTYATVVRDPDHVVHGLLWNLSLEHEASLDHYESVAKGHYYKETLEVVLASGDGASAMIYIATNSEPGRPREQYIQGILASALHFQFPEDYVATLKRWL